MKTETKNPNERGTALIPEIILLAVVLAAAGFAVFRYYENSKAVEPSARPVAHTPIQKRASPIATKTPAPAANVLKIKELGVEMTLPAELKTEDVYYIAASKNEPVTDGNGKTYHYLGNVYLSTHSLTTAAVGCGVVAGATDNIGVIGFEFYRENIRDYAVASGPEGVKPIGDMFVGIRDRQSPCSWDGSAPNPLEDKVYALFVAAYDTLKPISN